MVILLQSVFAQTEINHSIYLIDTDSLNRQIENLGSPNHENNASRPEDVKYARYNLAQASGNDTIELIFEEPFSRLTDGDLFFFIMPAISTTNFILSNSNMDTLFPLMINDMDTVRKHHIESGRLISAIYYRNKAFIVSSINKSCPQGFVQVNSNYCIETNESTATNYFQASANCIDKNAQLCNYAEWYFACYNSASLGISNMTNNYEWLDDTTNEDLQIRVVGSTACYIMANLNSTSGNLSYRCCYSLK